MQTTLDPPPPLHASYPCSSTHYGNENYSYSSAYRQLTRRRSPRLYWQFRLRAFPLPSIPFGQIAEDQDQHVTQWRSCSIEHLKNYREHIGAYWVAVQNAGKRVLLKICKDGGRRRRRGVFIEIAFPHTVWITLVQCHHFRALRCRIADASPSPILLRKG